MISSDEEDFDSLGGYISHSDEILAEAFERRVEEDSFGNSSIKYNGLKLKNKYRESVRW